MGACKRRAHDVSEDLPVGKTVLCAKQLCLAVVWEVVPVSRQQKQKQQDASEPSRTVTDY
jgi:hypothetical protein